MDDLGIEDLAIGGALSLFFGDTLVSLQRLEELSLIFSKYFISLIDALRIENYEQAMFAVIALIIIIALFIKAIIGLFISIVSGFISYGLFYIASHLVPSAAPVVLLLSELISPMAVYRIFQE